MCQPCWQATRHVAASRRPGLIITDTTLRIAATPASLTATRAIVPGG
jgi:hypothetical protein